MLWTYLFELMWLGEPFPCNRLALCGKPQLPVVASYCLQTLHAEQLSKSKEKNYLHLTCT